jgi:hypothetical protein
MPLARFPHVLVRCVETKVEVLKGQNGKIEEMPELAAILIMKNAEEDLKVTLTIRVRQ